MVTHASVLAWRIPRTEEPGGLQSRGFQRVRYNRSDKDCTLCNKNRKQPRLKKPSSSSPLPSLFHPDSLRKEESYLGNHSGF